MIERMKLVRTVRCGVLMLALLAAGYPPPMPAETPEPAATDTPTRVRLLLDLLDDPVVKSWLAERRSETPAAAPPPSEAQTTPSSFLATRLDAIEQNFSALSKALPGLPGELERAWIILRLEFEERGLIEVLALVVGFVLLGYGAEWLFLWGTRGLREWISGLPLESVADRLRAVLARLAFGIGLTAMFALGSVGAFITLDWPPLLKEIVLGYLVAFLYLRLALVVGRFLLAPGGRTFRNADRFRIVPMSTPSACYWQRRLGLIVGVLAFSWVTVGLLGTLGMPLDSRRLIAFALGLVLLGIGIEIAWRRPRQAHEGADPGRAVPGRTSAWVLSAYFLALWFLWVATAMRAFWLVVIVLALPWAVRITRRSVDHLLRTAEVPGADSEAPSLYAAYLERGLRAALIIGAAFVLAHTWGLDLGRLTASDTLLTRLLRGALSAVVIVLIADFAWHALKTVIDRKLAEAADKAGQANDEEARRRSRIRTLLPIVRNVVFIVLVVMVAMMALAAMGVEIGPLIAGAGVIGVAIGFGAQTLVKDIISGMFYLLDDAFRVGEYIQSGDYKGTVESFSLRSVKLRHHRGPLYTVPFGELGAVQNMSRDWVIDKLSIGITYDSDLEKARKLIKQIGKELTEDAELAPFIIEPLKMQGVEQFGDFAIQIRMKMMTKPGEQFVIRRRAYALIKKAFDENGIKFASPTVRVAGGGEETATVAAAQKGLELVQPPPAT